MAIQVAIRGIPLVRSRSQRRSSSRRSHRSQSRQPQRRLHWLETLLQRWNLVQSVDIDPTRSLYHSQDLKDGEVWVGAIQVKQVDPQSHSVQTPPRKLYDFMVPYERQKVRQIFHQNQITDPSRSGLAPLDPISIEDYRSAIAANQ